MTVYAMTLYAMTLVATTSCAISKLVTQSYAVIYGVPIFGVRKPEAISAQVFRSLYKCRTVRLLPRNKTAHFISIPVTAASSSREFDIFSLDFFFFFFILSFAFIFYFIFFYPHFIFVFLFILNLVMTTKPVRTVSRRACLSCREKKIKCDGVFTCRPCRLNNLPCIFVKSHRGSRRDRKPKAQKQLVAKSTDKAGDTKPLVIKPNGPKSGIESFVKSSSLNLNDSKQEALNSQTASCHYYLPPISSTIPSRSEPVNMPPIHQHLRSPPLPLITPSVDCGYELLPKTDTNSNGSNNDLNANIPSITNITKPPAISTTVSPSLSPSSSSVSLPPILPPVKSSFHASGQSISLPPLKPHVYTGFNRQRQSYGSELYPLASISSILPQPYTRSMYSCQFDGYSYKTSPTEKINNAPTCPPFDHTPSLCRHQCRTLQDTNPEVGIHSHDFQSHFRGPSFPPSPK